MVNENLLDRLHKKSDELSLEAAHEIKRLEDAVTWLLKKIEELEENKNG